MALDLGKFFNDPEWPKVQQLIRDYIEPLTDVLTIDVSQPAENVKAEVISRQISYQKLNKFLHESGIIKKDSEPVSFK